MTRSGLIDRVTEKAEGLTRKQTEFIVNIIFDSIKDALVKGGKIELRGFGNFRLKHRKPRRARNPKTGEKVEVSAKKVLFFKAGKGLKDALNA